jgi:hypothetical protein
VAVPVGFAGGTQCFVGGNGAYDAATAKRIMLAEDGPN